MPSLAKRLPEPRRLKNAAQALIASAKVKVDPDAAVVDKNNTGEGSAARAWQREVFDFYDLVGELHYAGTFIGSCLSRCRLVVALPDEEGNPTPAFADGEMGDDGKQLPPVPLHPDAEEALAHLRDLKAQIGGQSALMRSFGLNLFIAGEGYLVGTPDPVPGVPDRRSWEILSVEEIIPVKTPSDGRARYQRKMEPGDTAKDLPVDTVVIRVWRGHPRFTYMADAGTRAVREILEELVLLTRQVRGETLSRLANVGLFIIADEIDYPDDANADTESPEGDPFTRDFIKTISTAIADPGSAAGQVPFVLRPPAEYCSDQYIRHLEIKRPMDDKTVEKRAEAVLRFARGIDLPVEVVTGHAQTTFSNAWQIDESLFKSHIEPLVETVVDCLTVGYLHTLMPGTPLVYSYDPSELVAHPDRSKDAKDGHDRFVVSDSAYRRAIGFTDTDGPDADELDQRIEIAERIKTPGAVAAGTGAPAGPPTTSESPATSGLAAAADVTALRAVMRAGSRIRSKADATTKEVIRSIPDENVAATLGPAAVARIMGNEEPLLTGDFVALRKIAAGHVAPGDVDEVVKSAHKAAVRRLYEPV